MTLRNLHIALAWAVVLGNGLVGVWALAAHKLTALRVRALWPATGVAQVLIVVEVAVGVLNMQVKDLDVSSKHIFYGFVSAFTVGIIYSYRQQLEPWRYLLYGFGGLFLMGMGLRSMTIAPLAG